MKILNYIEDTECENRKCKHFMGYIRDSKSEDGYDAEALIPICSAFRDGIPDEIAYGANLHLLPFNGDSNIVYEKDDSSQIISAKKKKIIADIMRE